MQHFLTPCVAARLMCPFLSSAWLDLHHQHAQTDVSDTMGGSSGEVIKYVADGRLLAGEKSRSPPVDEPWPSVGTELFKNQKKD